ncbi:hypothetical protein SLS58_003589 [Diplodia intermedia]|uniref:Uncharacterized protein n=1 Tax=Diplodia intermedia TaxID=856260 RepID=A0ABR3TWB6_9PEZI
MPPGVEFTNNSCTTAHKPHLTFLTYDQVPYPHHLTRVIHTSDFIYRGPALETSLLEQASSQTHLFNLAIGRGIAGTFSPILLNAPAGSVQQVNLQDWVNGNLKGEHLDNAFWAPLVRLLEYVKEQWMEKDHGQAKERKCYELTVRAIQFGHGQGLMETRPFWHTEWWYPGDWQQPDSPVTAEDHSYEQPRFNVDRTPTLHVGTPTDEAKAHEAPATRVMAQLAGDGTLFMDDPFAVAALVRNSSDGIGHAVRASREGELVVWSVEDGGKGLGPVYAAPPMGAFQQAKAELIGGDRVFVSLVVGTEEQVRKMGSGLFGKGR